MLRYARSQHEEPRWFITDQGTEFTAKAVERWAKRHDIGHRFGAVGRKGSIARMERFWRSMKSEYARRLMLYRPRRTIERKLRIYARWFHTSRPHQGLGQRTPDQVHCRRRRKATKNFEHGRLEVHHEGSERTLPVLRLTHAA